MFNEEFFPTPADVIRKMLKPYQGKIYRGFSGHGESGYAKLEDLIILDPSAGKGDILDYITGSYVLSTRQVGGNSWDTTTANSVQKNSVYAIEKNPELAFILQEKGYRVLGNDFLTYNGSVAVDVILINPPFSNGDEHLLKAWDLLDNGDIVCLLNAETIKNPYTERRKLLAMIIEDNAGTVEYLGQCFKTAERTTDVEVAMVRLTKKTEKTRFDFEFENITKEKNFNLDADSIGNMPATLDVVGNMILQFDKARESFIQFMGAKEKVGFYTDNICNFHDGVLQFICNLKGSKKEQYNDFSTAIRGSMWRKVLDSLGMERYMTRAISDNFDHFIKNQGYLEFTKENVRGVLMMLLENGNSILEKAIPAVFDLFTQYHAENRCHIEGWKTNDKFKVNRKIILPHWVRYDGGYTSVANFSLSSRYTEYSDIDKVMCYITGTNFEECRKIYDVLANHFRCIAGRDYKRPGVDYDNEGETEFFKYRFFKKGTLHLVFKDEWLWQEFNMRACAEKQWLPEAEKKAWQEAKQPTPEPPKEVQFALPPVGNAEQIELF